MFQVYFPGVVQSHEMKLCARSFRDEISQPKVLLLVQLHGRQQDWACHSYQNTVRTSRRDVSRPQLQKESPCFFGQTLQQNFAPLIQMIVEDDYFPERARLLQHVDCPLRFRNFSAWVVLRFCPCKALTLHYKTFIFRREVELVSHPILEMYGPLWKEPYAGFVREEFAGEAFKVFPA